MRLLRHQSLVAEVSPNRAVGLYDGDYDGKSEIGRYVNNFPKQKRWRVHLVDKVADWDDVDRTLVLFMMSVEVDFTISAMSNKAVHGLM